MTDTIQFQKSLIGNLAHDIRTPLAIIKTSSEVALMDPHLSAEHREVFESTLAEVDRISEILNALLSTEN